MKKEEYIFGYTLILSMAVVVCAMIVTLINAFIQDVFNIKLIDYLK